MITDKVTKTKRQPSTRRKYPEEIRKIGERDIMKLADALKISKGRKRVMRCGHRDENFVRTHKQDLTPREEAHRKRIYGSEL